MRRILVKILKKFEYMLSKGYESRCSRAKILSIEGDIATVEALGLIWKLDTKRYLDRDILNNGIFEPYSTELIQELVKPNMVVGDIGANFGYYALQFGRLVGKSGYVYAFEPVQRYSVRLLEHLKLNNITNVEFVNKALSNRIGKAQISVGECSATFHSYSSNGPKELQEVSITTLDTFVKERGIGRLDFLKVDLDGHEPMFLEGAQNTLSKFKPIILIEFSQPNLHASGSAAWDLVDKLEDFGYVLVSTKNRKIFPNRPECLKEVANFSHSVNVLCIPSGSELLNIFGINR
ncbi:MAG: FkbM family methyltransferase [Planctomycetes bacterium]|nr:FkbM family methyltransferase [Planctomycetota bacterium]